MEQKPDSTAVRTALWRALHLELDPPPHVFQDDVGLKLAAPDEGWRGRQDMHPQYTRRLRSAIVARARFVEDCVLEQVDRGVGQYVLLGAGLDTFAQRKPDVAAKLRVFEVDRGPTQAWKRERLTQLGFGIPPFLRFVSVDFESGESWWQRLAESGFDAAQPALVASVGVSMYLSKDATTATLRQAAQLAPGSTFLMTFLLTVDFLEPEDRQMFEWAQKGAAASGTPFATLYSPAEMQQLARDAGFEGVRHVGGTSLRGTYFAGRTDGLSPASGEDFLVATT